MVGGMHQREEMRRGQIRKGEENEYYNNRDLLLIRVQYKGKSKL